MKKKIVFFMQLLKGGGAEKVIIDILNKIDVNKYDITLLLLFSTSDYKNILPEEIKVESIIKKSKGTLFDKLIYKFIKFFPKIFYYCFINKRYNIEIAFLEGYATKIISNSTNKKSRKIAWVHSDLSKFRWTKYVYRKGEEKRCYENFDNIVFVSKNAYEGFNCSVGLSDSVNYHVIYNPIINDNIEDLATEKDIKYDDFTIVSVGRLVEVKGYDRLIKVHANLIKEYPHKLVIIGDGEERGKLEALISELNIGETVEIMGFLENPYPYVKAANLFVSSSKSEGYGVAIAEAIILEKPILITNTSGAVEVVGGEENAIICENSQEGIQLAVRDILTNKIKLKYYEERSKERKRFFDYKIIINEIEELLDK